jgi:SAM-dependent methyltransferase
VFNDRLNAVVDLLPQRARILDLGCGFGRDVHFFRTLGFRAVGVDFSRQLIRAGKQLYGNIPLVHLDIRRVARHFKDTMFDCVWTRGVLVHLHPQDVGRLVAKLRTMLKQKGIVYVQMFRGDGTIDRAIAGTKAKVVYHLWRGEDFRSLMSSLDYSLLLDMSTEKETCHVYTKE